MWNKITFVANEWATKPANFGYFLNQFLEMPKTVEVMFLGEDKYGEEKTYHAKPKL